MKLSLLFTLSFLILTNYTVAQPQIDVASVNSEVILQYEKFEAIVNIEEVFYNNPYNPDEMDLRAVFISPGGKVWEIFGFYDNYQGRNQWKIRFAPNELGTWDYSIKLIHNGGHIEKSGFSFDVLQSGHKGWMHVSERNSHYFEYDNGESFYPVGPYYPWGIKNDNSNGLGLMQNSGANFFGYWNIMYGGESGIIESLNSGLGRYDQDKCGRIDQLIEWAEQRDMKMMLAIWPHDLLCETLGGWAKQWDQNPYKFITTSTEFFEDETAWSYQEKQYRYLIARWGYSRGLGIWEIVNEITGTDGWANGKEAEATNWVKKVSDYLKANDPFNRPTTASQHGGYYWSEGYPNFDISNVHVYETGWNAEFPGNPLRSSHFIYHNLSSRFWNDFKQPGIFGEAGYTNTYGNFATPSEGYTAHYHNALWASWSGGLAATPVWWDMGSRQIMSNDVMNQMKAFSKVVDLIEYNTHSFNPDETSMNQCDIYSMVGDTLTFGWIRENLGRPLSEKQFDIYGLPDTSYLVRWFDTWTGDELETSIGLSINDTLTISSPLSFTNPDYAFIINPLIGGGEPAALALTTDKSLLLSDGYSKTSVTCLVRDSEGLISTESEPQISLSLQGPGVLSETELTASGGFVKFYYQSVKEAGEVIIVAESPGLVPDTISITLSDKLYVDDFNGYTDMAILESVWQIQSGTTASISLVSSLDRLLKFDYSIGDGNPPYAGIQRNLSSDFTNTDVLQFKLIPDGSNRDLVIILRAGALYWRYDYALSGSETENLEIPVNEFIPQNSSDPVDLVNLTQISFSVLQGSGGAGSGTIYLDNIAFAIDGITGLKDVEEDLIVNEFKLFDNYPNPFNPVTNIRYSVPYDSHVKISVFNILGEQVTILTDNVHKQGIYELQFNAGNGFSSGTYFIRLQSGSYIKVNKMTLLK